MKLKSLLTLLIAFVLVGLNSCKKDTVDVTHLLSTVPSSAAGVVVFNMEALLDDAGCKVKDHEIIPGKEVKDIIEKADSKDKENYLMMFNGESGIEPKGAVLFYDSNRIFITVSLYDVNKFCNLVEKETGLTFSEEGSGVKVCDNYAVKGAQAWICLSQNKRIDADAIASYASLKESQSFLVTPMGEQLLIEENDIRGWAMISTFVNEMMSRQERGMLSMGMGFLFEDPESVKFKVDFEKGELETEAIVLNDKGRPAKYQLPSEKIDANILKSLGSTCDGMMAFTLNSKLVKKFEQISSAFGGGLFGDLTETLKNVDGTVGVAVSGEGVDESMNGVITTKGDISPMLRDLISRMIAPVSQDGKYLRFSKGDVKGKLTVEECADELKGCCLGIIVDPSSFQTVTNNSEASVPFRCLSIKFSPESGGLEMEMELKTLDPKENSLLTLLKN